MNRVVWSFVLYVGVVANSSNDDHATYEFIHPSPSTSLFVSPTTEKPNPHTAAEASSSSYDSLYNSSISNQENLTCPHCFGSVEKRLISELQMRYDRLGTLGRPVRNATETVSVIFGLGLIQMDLDERHKILSMSMWTRYQWKDDFLSWVPAEYNNISKIRLRPSMIWIPDIMLLNTASVENEARDTLAVVNSDGTVNWYPHCIFRSSCAVDVTNYPFDSQQCHMWFGSWTHPTHEVDLNMAFSAGIDLTTFRADHKESSGWDVANITATRKVMPSDEETPNFVVLTFDILLRRKMVFSTYMLTMPCVFLACLSLVVFWLPPERPDRTALAMSSFSSFMVLLLILVEAAMPTASSVPTLGVYYCFNMVLIMFAIILSSVVVNIHKGKIQCAPPKWLLCLTTYGIARVLCLRSVSKTPVSGQKKGHVMKGQKSSLKCPCAENGSLIHSDTCAINGNSSFDMQNYRDVYSGNDYVTSSECTTIQSSLPKDLTVLEASVKEVRKSVQRIEARLEAKLEYQDRSSIFLHQWRHVAMCLDRAFFILYVILIIASLVLLFPRPNEPSFLT